MSSRTPFAALAAAALMLSLAACGERGEPAEAPPRAPVAAAIAEAVVEQVALSVESTGSVHPWVRVEPGTKILGRVERVEADVGQRVRRGQLLASLERRDLEAAVDQARASVNMAGAQLDNARAQHVRMQALHARGSATDKNLEDAVSAFRIAEAAVRQAEANLAAAEVMLGYAVVRSPTDGFVTDRMVEPGDTVRPGEPLLRVEDLSRVKVVVAVPESDVSGLAPGDLARVLVGEPPSTREAEVRSVNPSGDPRSHTFDVRLDLDNADGRLKAGMFARVVFDRGVREGLFVPSGAVVERGALRGLFVLDDAGRGRLRWVRIGKALGDRVEILSGLRQGERYVVAPPMGFVDGTPVHGG